MSRPIKFFLLFTVCAIFSGEGLYAQLEWYVSGQSSTTLSDIVPQQSASEVYREGRTTALFTETLVGGGKIVPAVGLGLERIRFAPLADGDDQPEYFRLGVPVGMALRLREAETSFNVITTLMLQPSFTFGTTGIDENYGPRDVQWLAKVGGRVTLDPIFLGANFQPSLGDRWRDAPSASAYWTFFAGIRW
ncbi:hypothetical protein [Lewinella sp. W8]|uniref:hypothetical protein n=1 Tax=Lewinella sp. W8 TaxID=2528208 RepID=UPI001068BD82|nr:hypothetical protein [Lewinella sp. W8]MTB52295.1 hypothetical protein [Lewinella sp. W8]